MAVRKRKAVKPGYVLEGFGQGTCSGYGNLKKVPVSPLQAIRRFCWSCQGGHEFDWMCGDGRVEKAIRPYDEVKDCPVDTCWLHPFRTGRNPKIKGRKITTEQLAKMRAGKDAQTP